MATQSLYNASRGNLPGIELTDARALDHVSTLWVQLHMALSEALGLEFEPNEDIEQYTEAIANLQQYGDIWQKTAQEQMGIVDDEKAYSAELTEDLKAARAIISSVNELFVGADMDDDCRYLRVDAAKFNEIQDAIHLLRIQP